MIPRDYNPVGYLGPNWGAFLIWGFCSKGVNETRLDPEPSSRVGVSVGGQPTSVHVRLAPLLTGHPDFRPKEPPFPPPWGLSNLYEKTGSESTTDPELASSPVVTSFPHPRPAR
jgi:hypothetical protein